MLHLLTHKHWLQNMCVNPSVLSLKSNSLINEKCLELQKNKTQPATEQQMKRRKSSCCPFYNATKISQLTDRTLVRSPLPFSISTSILHSRSPSLSPPLSPPLSPSLSPPLSPSLSPPQSPSLSPSPSRSSSLDFSWHVISTAIILLQISAKISPNLTYNDLYATHNSTPLVCGHHQHPSPSQTSDFVQFYMFYITLRLMWRT